MRLLKKELRQIELYSTVYHTSLDGYYKDLRSRLEDWERKIKSGINDKTPSPAGGKWYIFERPAYLSQFNYNIDALRYLVRKLEDILSR